jgi:cytochrome P450 family 135
MPPRAGSSHSLPPGPRTASLHQTREWVRQPLAFLERCQAEYGDIFTIRLASTPPIVMLASPAAVREVFTGDPELLRAGEANSLLQAALGRSSLLLLDGEQHLRERRLMLPPFHGERMRAYGSLIAALAEREIGGWPSGTVFEVGSRFRRVALDVIVQAVFGVEEQDRIERLADALRRFLDTVTSPFRMLVLLSIKPDGLTVRAWQRHAPSIRRVDALIYDEIQRRRADPRTPEREDILSMLIPSMSDEQLRNELMTLLLAGHETSAAGLAWAVERLARHPGVLDRLSAEASGDADEYLDAVVKETLRVRPVLPAVFRALAAPVEIAGRELPANAWVAPCVHLVHRNPELYPEPDAFRPERFLEAQADTYGWIPFGGGTRRCLGGAFAMFEMKTVLRELVRLGSFGPAEADDEGVRRRGVVLVPGAGARIVWRAGYDAAGAAAGAAGTRVGGASR